MQGGIVELHGSLGSVIGGSGELGDALEDQAFEFERLDCGKIQVARNNGELERIGFTACSLPVEGDELEDGLIVGPELEVNQVEVELQHQFLLVDVRPKARNGKFLPAALVYLNVVLDLLEGEVVPCRDGEGKNVVGCDQERFLLGRNDPDGRRLVELNDDLECLGGLALPARLGGLNLNSSVGSRVAEDERGGQLQAVLARFELQLRCSRSGQVQSQDASGGRLVGMEDQFHLGSFPSR